MSTTLPRTETTAPWFDELLLPGFATAPRRGADFRRERVGVHETSLWLDNITRGLPTIFDQAIEHTSFYIVELARDREAGRLAASTGTPGAGTRNGAR
jgi:hypothetical protein